MAGPNLTPEDLLRDYPPEVQELARELRGHFQRLLPQATERTYPGWRAIGYRDRDAGYVGGVFLFPDRVRVYFEQGRLLPDPQGILEGDTKQTRYVTLTPGDAIPIEAIEGLVNAAVSVGSSGRIERQRQAHDASTSQGNGR